MDIIHTIVEFVKFGAAAGGLIFLGMRLPLYAELVFTDD
jgi:hypothetical protein